ncbi:delta-1-pyrroline-5-carboxylate dehydrogenase [Acidithiobacillus marinus]|uniref:Bifunctional protein PutA n=1 Tax=Acidithiobacillus marinus TaxID=187490 RepID=A0A2I1DQ63_9PROT|nr:L-glutamate gamma-semialdehyde dehydrogenase [Acidithiobacillus marinus]PKY12002.1 delta-1-pyrroline-5-carboxylate dehydrogenase [Acidithiobacillus marinus]
MSQTRLYSNSASPDEVHQPPESLDAAGLLPPPYRDEQEQVDSLLLALGDKLNWLEVIDQARPWVEAVRKQPAPFWALESLLKEYPITSAEGLALMRLAEALLRVPDTGTAALLAADQLGRAHFAGEEKQSWITQISGRVLILSRRLLAEKETRNLVQRLGMNTVVTAAVRAIALLGRQFVLGQDLGEARRRAGEARKKQPLLSYSYDMLGEGARNSADAARYAAAYESALRALATQPGNGGPRERDGISIKLSALHPRFEEAQRGRLWKELFPKLQQLAELAAQGRLNLTLDAEESDRLELQLDMLDALQQHLARHATCAGWEGLGIAVQAYQSRADAVIEEVLSRTRRNQSHLMLRLVKGAYWDMEIKRAQEMGLEGYPVFTHKHHSDISYLACAARLLEAANGPRALVYPQFATHNAATIAAVLRLAEQQPDARFEMQRLHGMGEGIYREVLRHGSIQRLRIYAPVGRHRDLLAYLVRRLLENGANTSFIHQLANQHVAAEDLLVSPLWRAEETALPRPAEIYGYLHGECRLNSQGMDMTYDTERSPVLAAARALRVQTPEEITAENVDPLMHTLHAGQVRWDALPVERRAEILTQAADLLESRREPMLALVMREAHKTLADAVAELREAVDFCRYYAIQAKALMRKEVLPGPTGEANSLNLRGRGVFVCISPWNFPLAIFAGQVVAALVTGNSVAAKPAEQTMAIAQAFVELLWEAGVPRDALALMPGAGETVGAALTEHPLTAGVIFTGSTAVARHIHQSLAVKDGPIVPLIAETGGINAMIVDSTALAEQVVDAVIASAFRSAGQRCSALRLLCLQEECADEILTMLTGAMQELVIGPALDYATDVSPVIDAEAQSHLVEQIGRIGQGGGKLLARTAWPAALLESARGGDTSLALTIADDQQRDLHFVAPCAYAINHVSQVREEIFGPVLQVVTWKAGQIDALIDAINALGFGLTLGVQTRIDGRAAHIAARSRCGNVYVNRNMIGAVVGVQPFGGEGLSGTGPKAGGPHYLLRMVAEQAVSINTTAAGGNAELLAQGRL